MPGSKNPYAALSKATGISAPPEPSWSRKFLELATGYPASKDEEVGISDLLLAGLPFSSIVKGPVFHGTQAAIKRFRPDKNAKGSLLSGMTHFAENPYYADLYAKGVMAGSPETLSKYMGKGQNIIPANIHAKNTLDLTKQLNPDDFQAVMANLGPYERKEILEQLRLYKGRENEFPEEVLGEYIDNPKFLEKMPFDAIRYDRTSPSWAVPRRTGITTPGGVDLSPLPIRKKGIGIGRQLVSKNK